MNNTLLSTAFLALISTNTFADTSLQPNLPTVNQTAPMITAPQNATTSTQPKPMINCSYHIPAETAHVEESVITTWARVAAVQSFEFTPSQIDQELAALKSCYTETGWKGFNDAVQKAGNIEAIKTQHLTVSSQMDGEVKLIDVKDNQWRVSVPLQVVYQNDKEKLTQLLSVELFIGRKMSGDLGIMQLLATPRPTETTSVPNAQQRTEPTPVTTPTVPTNTSFPTQAPTSLNPTATIPSH